MSKTFTTEELFGTEDKTFSTEELFGTEQFTTEELFDEPIDTSDNALTQAFKGVTSPFSGGGQKFDKQTTDKARKMLKDKGFEADSWADSAVTAAMSFADTLSFGNLSEIRSAISDVPEEVYEAALELRQEKQPWSAAGGSLAGYMVPGLGTAKLAGKAAQIGIPAAQALAMGVQKADEGKEVEGLSRAIAEEVIGFGAGKALGAVFRGKSPKAVKSDLLDQGLGSEQADAIVAKATKYRQELDDAIADVNSLDPKMTEQFEKVILGGQKVADYEKYYGGMDGPLAQYKDMLAKKQAMLEESGLEQQSAAWLGMKMMDAQYVGNMADRRYGTDLMPTMNDVSRNSIEGLWQAKDLKTKAQNVIDRLEINTPAKSANIIKEIEDGGGPQELRDLFEYMRTEVNKSYEAKGLGKNVIEKRDNYIPHYMKRPAELIATLRNQVKNTIGQDSLRVGLKEIEDIKADSDLMESLKYIGGYLGKKENMLTDERLIKLVRSLNHSNASKQMMDTAAASVKERMNEKMPSLIQETDIGKLVGSWIDSTTSDAAMRKNLMKLRADAEAIKAVDPQMGAYLNNYVKDVSGGSRGLAGWAKGRMNNFSTNHLEKALEATQKGSTLKAGYHEAMAELPQYMQYMQAQLYPYFLGMRVDAVGRNLTQPYMLTLPEIGGSADYKKQLIMNSMPNSIKGMFTGEKSEVFQELKKGGWLPPDPTPGQFQALRKGVQTGGKFKKGARKLLEKANNLAMIGYQQSDIANRVVTLGVGKKLAADALAGNKNALQYVQKMPPAYRAKTIRAIQAGDNDIVQDTILDHLMATTQFNYNRASMSEYGREAGSAFSQFSKWPTAIGADIYDGFDAAKFESQKFGTRLPGGGEKVLRKYLAPYLMMVGGSRLFFGEDGPSEREKQIFSADPSSSAPITSVLSPASDPGRAFTPPVFQAVKEFISGDGVNTTFGLLPLATYGRFMVERLPPLVEDERGQKPSEFIKEIVE